MGKFMSLKLEDCENPDTLFFQANNLGKEIQHHGETIFDSPYEDAVIRAILNSFSDLKVAVDKTLSFSNRFN